MGALRNLMCRYVSCQRCRVYETDDGIGGKCIDCGKVHGWVTRDELRAYSDRFFGARSAIEPPCGEDVKT